MYSLSLINSNLISSFYNDSSLLYKMFERTFNELNIPNQKIQIACKLTYTKIVKELIQFDKIFMIESLIIFSVILFCIQSAYNLKQSELNYFKRNIKNDEIIQITKQINSKYTYLNKFLKSSNLDNEISFKYLQNEDLDYYIQDNINTKPVHSQPKIQLVIGDDCPSREELVCDHLIFEFRRVSTCSHEELSPLLFFFFENLRQYFSFDQNFALEVNIINSLKKSFISL